MEPSLPLQFVLHGVAEEAREICSARTFPVARETLYAAFTDPAVLASWWGPHGSVNTFEAFDLRPGGVWRFVMRAVDGAEHQMVNEFVEVVAPERIVLRHLQVDHSFELHMDFDEAGEGYTRMRWRMRFDDAAEADRVRGFVAAANEQNFDRLEAVLGVPSGQAGAAAGRRDG